MKRPITSIPVFALDPSSDWGDLLNAMEASVRYQTQSRRRFGPLFAFAPMTEPENLDRWEPLRTTPENLLAVSIERSEDSRLLQAFKQAAAAVGPLLQHSPDSPVQIHDDRLLADVFSQMEKLAVTAFCRLGLHKDDASFFFLRGQGAIRAVNEQLRTLEKK